MTKTVIELKDLAVGDIIWTGVIININDLANPSSTSGTTKNAKRGKPVNRMCIVLVPGQSYIEVTYISTFDGSQNLPIAIDKEMWYPFLPATQEAPYTPLPPAVRGERMWASLRAKQSVTINPVEKLPYTVPIETVDIILGAMKS